MDDRIVTVAVVGAGGYAAYELLYKPWAIRQELQRLADAAALAALKKGGTKEAIESVIAGACTAGAAVYKVPPGLAAPLCQGVGLLAVKGAVAAAKGAAIAGKVIGKGALAAGKGIGQGAKTIGYTAPKAGVKVAAKGVKAAAKGVRKVLNLFDGLAGVGPARAFGPYETDELSARHRPAGLGYLAAFEAPAPHNPFAGHGGKRLPARKLRGLAGVPQTARARGAAYYTRHL